MFGGTQHTRLWRSSKQVRSSPIGLSRSNLDYTVTGAPPIARAVPFDPTSLARTHRHCTPALPLGPEL
eukprot:2968033-Amphidinium_carterae.1